MLIKNNNQSSCTALLIPGFPKVEFLGVWQSHVVCKRLLWPLTMCPLIWIHTVTEWSVFQGRCCQLITFCCQFACRFLCFQSMGNLVSISGFYTYYMWCCQSVQLWALSCPRIPFPSKLSLYPGGRMSNRAERSCSDRCVSFRHHRHVPGHDSWGGLRWYSNLRMATCCLLSNVLDLQFAVLTAAVNKGPVCRM